MRMFLVLFALVFLVFVAVAAHRTDSEKKTGVVAQCEYRADGWLPDPDCTPGALNPEVTQATISDTICVKGWTDTVRPSSTKSNRLKYVSMRQYADRFGADHYEFDHLVALELGGAKLNLKNMWPQSHVNSYKKDYVENKLRRLVCQHFITLAQAQAIIRTDWRKAR